MIQQHLLSGCVPSGLSDMNKMSPADPSRLKASLQPSENLSDTVQQMHPSVFDTFALSPHKLFLQDVQPTATLLCENSTKQSQLI